MNTGLTMITNTKLINRQLEGIVTEAVLGGVDTVVLREKEMAAGPLYRLAGSLKEITARYNKNLIINDRIDIAIAVGARGVHLGQNSIPVNIARSLLGSDYVIGVSTHSLEEALAAQKGGADYIFLGHIYPTRSKPGIPPRGAELLKKVKNALDIPVTPIGGINSTNISLFNSLGIKNAAIMYELLTSPNPSETARVLREKLINP